MGWENLAGHRRGDAVCPLCGIGYPVACRCGGWIHADGEQGVCACDRCDGAFVLSQPFNLDGVPHAPGRFDCPACPDMNGPAACVCGGLVHQGENDQRACDRCGSRWQEVDL